MCELVDVEEQMIALGMTGELNQYVGASVSCERASEDYFNLIQPSIGDGDYKADLDTVNIARIIMTNRNISIIDVINSYYEGIENGSINRANDFLANMGGKKAFEEFFEKTEYIPGIRNRKNLVAFNFKNHVLKGLQNWNEIKVIHDVIISKV